MLTTSYFYTLYEKMRNKQLLLIWPDKESGCESVDFKTKYFEIWKTAWDFHKKWCSNSGTDREWEQIVEESGDIMKQYEGKPEWNFMKGLLLTVLSELEKIDKEKRKDGVNNG